MIINENSWHFKIYAMFNSTWNRPKTLCAYFWKTFIPVLAVSIVGFATLAGAAIIGQEILTKFFVFSSLWTLVPASIGIGILTISVMVLIAVGLVIGPSWLLDKYNDRKYYKEIELIAQNQERIKNGLEPIERKKSLIGEYLKARKEKVCPTLEYKAK
ncbi:membrane protein [Escherichia phage vB_EcoM_JS09]|uniref:Signal-peptide domain-containing protein n=1 Tax=Escherichia phage vB_EcoM_JS09 TaxID=1430444 RepID=A0A060BHS0_9CAUD|nr:membrane protein [Escherichia phage vB_EcoM_JS09]AIA80050.1 hypothetical protein JS09_083 [Escherichia phage vB_EcoM_JS09]